MNDRRIYLIDATAFCYRAFYALKGLATSFGQPTNAIYGFMNILQKILKTKKPEYMAVCFDVSRDTFRQKKFADYKIQRPPMPEGLSSQMPFIKEILAGHGIAVYEKEGFEADDIIATLSSKARAAGFLTTIVSSDKDILQLVDDSTVVLSPSKEEEVVYDVRKVRERFGVGPDAIPDIIALMGDSVDNIPGVHGVGEKTAIELIKTFHSAENLIRNTDRIAHDKLRVTLEQNVENIRLSRDLALLERTLDLDFDLKKLKIAVPNYRELFRIFKYLEFKKFLKELPLAEEAPLEFKVPPVAGNEIVVHGNSLSDLVLYRGRELLQFKKNDTGIKEVLASMQVKKIGHDLKKISVVCARDKVTLSGIYFDTMIAGYLLNPARASYSLSELTWDYFGGMVEEKALGGERAVGAILKLKSKLQQELDEKALLPLFHEVEMPLVSVLADMEVTGIKLDVRLLKQLSKDLETRLIHLIEKIYDISGCQFNINSPKQLREILFVRLKLPVVKKSKTGPSTDEEVLRTLAPQHELPALLLEYRQLTKLKTTYIDTLPDMVDLKTGRIHSAFNQTGTETGRLSSSSPNLQNIPIKTDIGRKIRQAIVAFEEGDFLVSSDYSQIELRILAHLSKDENLIQAFRENKDIHRLTATLIYGLGERDITEQMREVAKRVNFGIIYGLTSYGLSRDLGVALDDAERFIDAYFLRYPAVKEYILEQIKRAKKDGFVTTILGRRRYIPEINNKNQAIRQFAERQAVNTPIQGSASDLIKLAMVRIHAQILKRNLRSRMIMQIHDELVFNMKEKEEDGFIDLVREGMEEVLELDVPIVVSIQKGRNWLEMEEAK